VYISKFEKIKLQKMVVLRVGIIDESDFTVNNHLSKIPVFYSYSFIDPGSIQSPIEDK
jgi:hypothetical protein